MTNGAPRFQDIVNLMNQLVPLNDGNIGGAPHGDFWRGVDRNTFVASTTASWHVGFTGPLVVPGSPQQSNFYLALAGLNPFDGSSFNQMPDTGRDPNARTATNAELALVATWITNNAPA
jgi:hypothetical protein